VHAPVPLDGVQRRVLGLPRVLAAQLRLAPRVSEAGHIEGGDHVTCAASCNNINKYININILNTYTHNYKKVVIVFTP
jgi:hypothetical protein